MPARPAAMVGWPPVDLARAGGTALLTNVEPATSYTTEQQAEHAIVVGLSGSTGLAVVRALAQAGVSVHALHYDLAAPAAQTRRARVYLAPDWTRQPDALVPRVLEVAAAIGSSAGCGPRDDEGRGADAANAGAAAPVASLTVCHDAALQPVAAAADELRAAGVRPTFSARRSLAELVDKPTQYAAATRAEVDIPWTRWGTGAELVESIGDDCPLPAIVKPALSHEGGPVLGAKVVRCDDLPSLRATLSRVPTLPVIVQEFIPGGDDALYTAGVFVCDRDQLVFTGRKLRQHPPSLGIARLAEAVDVPAIVPGSVRLLRELTYQGVAQVEYKRDPRDGSFRLMEVNFRPWTWIGLATACGVNLPLAAHRWALQDADTESRSAQTPLPSGAMADGQSAPRPTHAASGHDAPPSPDLRSPGAPSRTATSAKPRRWIWLRAELTYVVRDLLQGRRPHLPSVRRLRAEAFFSRADPLPFLYGWLPDTVRRAVRVPKIGSHSPSDVRPPSLRVRLLAYRVLRGPAFLLNALALQLLWRAERRRRESPRIVVGLPPRGSLLILAPHPDDETIMCGATAVRLLAEGQRVLLAVLTEGSATQARGDGTTSVETLRRAELDAALAALGIHDVEQWRLPDGELAARHDEITAHIAAALARHHPDWVVVPMSFDRHADHRATALALAAALEDQAHAPRVLCAPVLMPMDPGWVTRLVPAGPVWEKKRAAVAAYATRGAGIFSSPLQLSRLHPAHLLRPAEWFVELSAPGYVRLVEAMVAEGLTEPHTRGGAHPLNAFRQLLSERGRRARIGQLIDEMRRAEAAGSRPLSVPPADTTV